jgi:periplasmic protein TonB
MHALEPDPEQKNRWRRLTSGMVIAGGLAFGLFFAAQHVEPARRLMPEILQIAVVDDVTPPKQDIPPPPPPPPPPPRPKNKEPEQPKEKPVEQEPPPDQQQAEAEPAGDQAGLDSTSFGAGSGNGVSFRAGNTQMGDPNRAAKRIEPPKVSMGPAPKLAPARALNPELPTYPERARKLNIQGFVVLEAEIDERGAITALRVRDSLEPTLDQTALASVKRWKFQPATLAGRPMPSTRLIRIRFELD